MKSALLLLLAGLVVCILADEAEVVEESLASQDADDSEVEEILELRRSDATKKHPKVKKKRGKATTQLCRKFPITCMVLCNVVPSICSKEASKRYRTALELLEKIPPSVDEDGNHIPPPAPVFHSSVVIPADELSTLAREEEERLEKEEEKKSRQKEEREQEEAYQRGRGMKIRKEIETEEDETEYESDYDDDVYLIR